MVLHRKIIFFNFINDFGGKPRPQKKKFPAGVKYMPWTWKHLLLEKENKSQTRICMYMQKYTTTWHKTIQRQEGLVILAIWTCSAVLPIRFWNTEAQGETVPRIFPEHYDPKIWQHYTQNSAHTSRYILYTIMRNIGNIDTWLTMTHSNSNPKHVPKTGK